MSRRVNSRVVVVGAGIAGVSCARTLSEAGVAVSVLDRGREPGGRLGLRSYDGRPVDVGASYFTVADRGFATVVDDWRRRGLARPWTDTFTVHEVEGRDGAAGPTQRSSTGPVRWAAPAGLRSLVEDLARDLPLTSEARVGRVGRSQSGSSGPGVLAVDGQPADAVVLAMPDPQANRLLSPELAESLGPLDVAYRPILALTTIWPERAWDLTDGMFVNGDDVLSFVADDGRRRGDGAPVLVAHSTPGFARDRLEAPYLGTQPMTDRLRSLLGIPDAREPSLATVQRWAFAKPERGRDEPYRLTEDLLGICGDGWGPKASVETAYVSGRSLGRALTERLAA